MVSQGDAGSQGPGVAALTAAEEAARAFPGESIPPWFGVFGERAREVERHEMDAIRESIARGISKDLYRVSTTITGPQAVSRMLPSA